MALPPKRKPQKSGIARGMQREWPRHRKFVRGHACSVPGCDGSPIECAHVRVGYLSGTSIKPPDWMTISLCAHHHREQHQIGHAAFDKKYRIDSVKLALAFAKASPDLAMREAMALTNAAE